MFQLTINQQPSDLVSLMEKANAFIRRAKSDSTIRAYSSDWRDFAGWARNQRWRALRVVLQDRRDAVDTLLELRRGTVEATLHEEVNGSPAVAEAPRPRIKRYRNE